MDRVRGRLRISAMLLLLAGTSACSSLISNLRVGPLRTGCPVVPMPREKLTQNDDIRAQFRFRIGREEIGFEVVARSQQDALVVVGLSPNGSRLFTVHQRDGKFEVAGGTSKKLRILALWTMDALHRAYWIQPLTTPLVAVSRFEWFGDEVLEAQHDGRRQRQFARAGSDFAAPVVTIDYLAERAPGSTGRVEIHNELCGYEAVVALLDQ